VLDRGLPIVQTLGKSSFCPTGYARDVPFGCVERGLLSLLYFLPGQAMAPHRHMDADEYFTAIEGEADMIVNGNRPFHRATHFCASAGPYTQSAIRAKDGSWCRASNRPFPVMRRQYGSALFGGPPVMPGCAVRVAGADSAKRMRV
jgi:hypothetical protein